MLVTCSVHANEIGATQMALELVHQLATDDSPAVKNILDNVIVLLVPSANPDGQIVVTDWFNRNLGTPFEISPLPYLYHPYVGHDSNRDMYMFTQKESQYMAQLVWHDWFPSVWLDQHQMSANGARMFVMPATDPINPNVHPLIYRWNAHPRPVAGRGARSRRQGRHHLQLDVHELLAGRDGVERLVAQPDRAAHRGGERARSPRRSSSSARTPAPTAVAGRTAGPRAAGPRSTARRLPPPTDTTPRTEYPRPWMGGRWTLRDIVDYELISTMALLETAADRRETILRQIYEVNRQTVEEGRPGDVDGDPRAGREPARPARGGAPGRSADDGRRRGVPRATRRSRRTADATPPAPSSSR